MARAILTTKAEAAAGFLVNPAERQAARPPLTVEDVFREHAVFVWKKLRKFGVLERDVEDMVQEVFIVVQRKLPEFEGRSKVETWLYAICLKKAAAYRRLARHRRELPVEDISDSQPPPPNTFETAPDGERVKQILAQALDELDEKKRQIFILYEVEQRSMAEITQLTGTQLFTAYSRLRAARQTLKAKLSARGIGL